LVNYRKEKKNEVCWLLCNLRYAKTGWWFPYPCGGFKESIDLQLIAMSFYYFDLIGCKVCCTNFFIWLFYPIFKSKILQVEKESVILSSTCCYTIIGASASIWTFTIITAVRKSGKIEFSHSRSSSAMQKQNVVTSLLFI
jgi:hypothetical protein